MNLTKYALLSSFALLSCSLAPLFADLTPGDLQASEVEDEQLKVIRQYIDSKRNISISQKGGNLKIGGDVRVDYKRVRQVLDGQHVEGYGNGGDRGLYVNDPNKETNIPSGYMDVAASLSFEYRQEKSFANILVKMNNRAGLDTTNFSDASSLLPASRLDYKSTYAPTKNRLDLARAYIGYELWQQDSHRVEGNLGRQRLYDLFDSRVMFVNRFDGVAVKYSGAFEGIGHAHATYGLFLVSDRAKHYAHAIEMGLSQVADTGLGLKYALIDWSNDRYSDGSRGNLSDDAWENKAGVNPTYQYFNEAFRFTVSQVLATYEMPEEYTFGKRVKLYAAYLYNHKARGMKNFYEDGSGKDRENRRAWYAGFSLGRITMPGDAVFDICYQHVEPQSVPDFDSFGGAGRGNLTGVWGVVDHSQGNNNYKGVRAQFAYCATPDIMLNVTAAHSVAADRDLTSKNNLMRKAVTSNLRKARNTWDSVEVEVVYSF